jgi:hypothetical protein
MWLSVNSVLGGWHLAQTRGIIKCRRKIVIHLPVSVSFSVRQNHITGEGILLRTSFCPCDKDIWKVPVPFISPYFITFCMYFIRCEFSSHSWSAICTYMIKWILFIQLEPSKWNHVTPIWRSKRRKSRGCEGAQNPFPGATGETTHMNLIYVRL